MGSGIRTLQFIVPGQAVPEPKRKALFPPKKSEPISIWRTRAGLAASIAMEKYGYTPFQSMVALTILCVFPRPGRLLWKTRLMPRMYLGKTPDITNLTKAIEDSVKGIVWKDDSLVVSQHVRKAYAAAIWNAAEKRYEEETPCAFITVREVPDAACVSVYSEFEKNPFILEAIGHG